MRRVSGPAPVLQLNSRDAQREMKKRASNWVLYSFSNAFHLEDHMRLQDYGFKPHELIEVSDCAELVSVYSTARG